jgi:Phosphoglycerol transferase and related proteins, alkaline phosphatase superfamily
MSSFFLFVKLLFFFGLAFYCILRKNELAVFYLPVLFFAEKVVGAISPAFLFYATICLIYVMLIIRNGLFFRNNVWALILIVYFLILLNNSSDLTTIRPHFFAVMWLFILIPLIPAIYKKHSAETVFKELSNACLLILILFLANSLVSSVYKFSPTEMYGFTSGILFGNLWAAAFNTLAIALFVVFFKGVTERKFIYLAVAIVSFFFIMLTLRRSVIGLSALGILIVMLSMMTRQKAKMIFVTASLLLVAGVVIYTQTDFMDEFIGRVEQRKLEDRELTEEKRYIEYSLIYDDMFVYHAYSPWFGYELFNSGGNYGKGILADRSLHGDITNLLHSSGVLGVLLYLCMVATAFWQAIRAAKQPRDKWIILFSACVFTVYTLTGRYTEVAASSLLYLVLMLPLASQEEEQPELAETMPEPAVNKA